MRVVITVTPLAIGPSSGEIHACPVMLGRPRPEGCGLVDEGRLTPPRVSPLPPGSPPLTFSFLTHLVASRRFIHSLRFESAQKFEQRRVDLLGPLKLDPVTGTP